MVVSVGVDVSKDKHDCFILSSEGEVLADVFTIPNNLDGFRFLTDLPDSSTLHSRNFKR
ncbi:IS110 family transposase [Pseudoflavonifractor phocaeensis]|uniref:IS110 family transposase n=1 Tax=Pseudoflavonifractor phocaeensis TaxID=1870988 RepID=UPI003B969D09